MPIHVDPPSSSDSASRNESASAPPRGAQRTRLLKKDLEKFGYTPGCRGCDTRRPGRNLPEWMLANHNEQCRQRLEEALRKDPAGQSRIDRANDRITQSDPSIASNGVGSNGSGASGSGSTPTPSSDLPGQDNGTIAKGRSQPYGAPPVTRKPMPWDMPDRSEPNSTDDQSRQTHGGAAARGGDGVLRPGEPSNDEPSSKRHCSDDSNRDALAADSDLFFDCVEIPERLPESNALRLDNLEDVVYISSTTTFGDDGYISGCISELYSPPRVAPLAPNIGLQVGDSFDRLTKDECGNSWDFDSEAQRRRCLDRIRRTRPLLVVGSPMCSLRSRTSRLSHFMGSPLCIGFCAATRCAFIDTRHVYCRDDGGGKAGA